MKNKKRWLAGLLAVILIMNTFVGSALAKNEDGVNTEAVVEQTTETAATAEEKATEAEKSTIEESKTAESSTKSTEEKKEQIATTEEKKETTTATKEKKTTKQVNKIKVQNAGEENAVYVGTSIVNDDESATKGKDWLHAFSSLNDAYSEVEDGGTIYVVGQLTVNKWPQTNGKKVKISAYYQDKPEDLADKYIENYEKTKTSKILIGGDIVLSGDVVFEGWNYKDSENSKKLYISNADNKQHEIYPEGYKLQVGNTDNDKKPYDDVAILQYNSTNTRGLANLHINTELYDKGKVDDAGVLDLRLYGDNQYYISINESCSGTYQYGFESVNIEIIGTGQEGKSVNDSKGWNGVSHAVIKNDSYTKPIIPRLSKKTKSVNVEFRNFETNGAVHIHSEKQGKQEYNDPGSYTEKQSYVHGVVPATFCVGSYYTTQNADIDLKDIYMKGILCQNIWSSMCDNLTYNITDSTISRISGQWQNNGYAPMNKGILTVNLKDSKIDQYAYLYTDNTSNPEYSVIINAEGKSSIGEEIRTRETDNILLNVKSGAHFYGDFSEFQMDVTIAESGTLEMSTGEVRCKTLKAEKGAILKLKPQSKLRVKNQFEGELKLEIDGITSVEGAGNTTSVNCRWSAGSIKDGSEVVYSGNLENEAITEVKNQDNGSYYSKDQNIGVDKDAIYVQDAGSDTNDGHDYWNAVSTLSKAYEKAVENKKSKIIICGKVSYSSDINNYNGSKWNMFSADKTADDMITVTTVSNLEDGTKKEFKDGEIELASVTKSAANTPTNFSSMNNLCHSLKFENITFFSNTDSANIFANGNKTVIAKNVTTPTATALYGGAFEKTLKSTDLTVESGSYGTVNGGSIGAPSKITIEGDVSVKVYGGKFTTADTTYNSDSNWAATIVGSGPGHVKGNINVEVEGTDDSVVTKPIQIIGLSSRGFNGSHTFEYSNNVISDGKISVSVKGNIEFANSMLSGVVGVFGGRADNVDVSVTDCNSKNPYSTMAYCSYITSRGDEGQSETGKAQINISNSKNILGVFGNSNSVKVKTTYPEYLKGNLSVNIQNSSVDKVYLGDGNFTSSGILSSADKSDRKVFKEADLTIQDSDIGTVNGLNYGMEDSVENNNRTATILGKCNIQDEIAAFNKVTIGNQDVKSSFGFSGKVVQAEQMNVENTDMTFTQNCQMKGNYKAGNNVNLNIGQNGTITFNGKIEGSTKLSSVNSVESATVKASNYNTENVPEQESAFTGDNIKFKQEDTTAIWNIEGKDPREKRSVIYVRNAVEDEDTMETDPEKYIIEHDGSNYDKAVHSMEEAYRLLDVSDGTGVIVICGKLTIKNNYMVPEIDGTVKWTSVYNSNDYRTQDGNPAYLYLSGKGSAYVGINSDLKIRDMNICYESSVNVGIDANGHKLSIGTDIGVDVRTPKDSDVKIAPAVDGNMGTGKPNNFYIIGAGMSSKQVDNIEVELYNTTIGGVIAMYGNVTVGSEETSGNVKIKVRDTDLLQKKYYISSDENGNIQNSTIYGNIEISEELYSRNLNFVQEEKGQNTKVTDTATRNYINKTNTDKGIDWTKFENFVKADKKTSILLDANDNELTGGFQAQFMMPLTGTLYQSESTEITILGRYSADNQFWNWENEKQNENNSLRIQLGNAERGSYAKLNNFLSTNTNGGATDSRVRKSIRVEIYPGTKIGAEKDYRIFADNYTKSEYCKLPICTKEEGYPVLAFYSSKDKPDATYDIQELRKFSIEANNCSVVNHDEASTVSSIFLKNGGTYEEPYNTSGAISLKKVQLKDNEDVFGGGRLYISGKGSQLKNIAGYSVEGDCTIKDSSLDIEGYNTFGKIIGIGNASLNAEAGTTIISDSAEIQNESIILNCLSDEAPTAANGKLPIKITVNDTNVDENLFKAGKTANGSVIESLKVTKSTDSISWTIGTEEINASNIFISDTGNDENTGADSAHPVKTLNQAFKLAREKYEASTDWETTPVFHIIVCGSIDLTQSVDGFDPDGYKVIMRPMSSRYKQIKLTKSVSLPAAITLEKFEFIGSNNSNDIVGVFAEGHDLTIGSENSTKGYISLYGGSRENALISKSGYTLTVESGNWYRVYGAGKDQTTTVGNGKITVNIGNAEKKTAPTICSEEDQDQGVQVYGIFGGGEDSSAEVEADTEVNILYGKEYSNIYGSGWNASQTGNAKVVVSGDSVIRRIYGSSYQGSLSGNTEIEVISGTIDRVYGGGSVEDKAIVNGNTKVSLGAGNRASKEDKTIVRNYIRGSGDRAGVTGTSELLIQNGAEIPEGCNVSAGGYKGGVKKSILTVTGGTVNCDLFAGGAGAYKSGTLIVDTSLGIVNSSQVNITGGTIKGNVFAGGNMGYVGSGTAQDKDLSTVSLKGGTITGNIYGGCNIATTYGNTDLTIEGSSVKGNVYGGGKGTDDTAAEITGTTNVKVNDSGVDGNIYGGCDTNGTVTNTKVTAIVLPNGNLFAGGYGEKTKVTDTAHLTLKANDTADKTNKFTAYGGGEKGIVKKTQVNADNWNGDIFAGGKGELKTKNRLGRVLLRIFTESDLIDANVSETNVNVTGIVTGDIFAGGEYATVGTTNESADADELSKEVSKVTIAGTVNGKVYGGGKGEKDKNYAAINGSTNVTLKKGGNVTVSGHAEDAKTGVIFGGGQNAPVAGNTNVNVTDGTYSTIFGGNDVSGEIQGNTNVNITGAKTEHAYGAGRDAKYDGTGANITVNDETSKTADSNPTVSEVYGGGYGEGAETTKADVSIKNGTVTTAYAGGNAASTKDTKISVTGGKTDMVFGGGNAATITGSSKVTVNTTDDTQHVDTIFAGNNKASMAIKPTLDFQSGKIGTVYCGGNQGIMTYKSDANSGISYDFDYPATEIKTVFAGCNNTTETTSDVKLTLISGTYGTVYGGNNQNGTMDHTSVITDASKNSTKSLNIDTIYGGGNQADAVNTSVTLKNGTVKTVYAGGNAATVTQSATVNTNGQTTDDNAKVTDLYCGNNEASMAIKPAADLKKAEITNFYGGGNQGAMTNPEGLTYTFNSDDLTIDTIYGGGNEAGVTKSVALNVEKGNYTNIYGGSNSKGTVDTANVNIQGNVGDEDKTDAKVFGGGRGKSTLVNNTNVSLKDGTIAGNVYGGSGFGTVGTAKVSAEESSNGTVKVLGNIYGAGYGVTSSADDTQVDVNLNLSMGKDDDSKDVNITEILKSTDSTDKSGESKASATWKTSYKEGSYIAGNVFGGGDMGQVGQGYINASTNTAVIEKGGKTSVNVKNGYIHGNIFGGGNGQPGGEDESGNKITEYTVYMGTVFGTSNVNMTGGYVNGNIFGCGQQSRTYAAADQNNDDQKDASYVNITTDNNTPILIGGSIFGGGNKGNGTTQNASVATVYGDTHVELQGVKGQYTQIYLLSNGTSGGGVYGDGNLCLVSGKKYVTLKDFSCGAQNSAKLLKTFYSLQRADVVDIIASRIVLKGAVDLVAENADDTTYSVNRVSQLNLKDSSTLKVTKTVNLLGELTSDEQTNRQFINRGNNNGNAYVGNDYTKHGGSAPARPLTESEVQNYINAYNSYAENGSIQAGSSYNSINVVCVANGGYLEVKKSAKEYGPVTGLFTLQLVNANPGEGGGFVYADIMGKQVNGKYITGNFVSVTKQSEESTGYMYAYHNVGGQLSDDGKYEYYLWYLKGNKYSYDVDLTSYIGTKDTEFTKTISLSVEPSYCFILTELNQTKELSGINLNKMYQNTWSKSKEDSDRFAVEVTLIKKSKSGNNITTDEKSIGYIGYQTTSSTDPEASAEKDVNGNLVWGIWRSDGKNGWKFQACKGNNNSFKVESEDELAEIGSDVVNAQLKFTLHKGTGMTTEFRNLPFEMKIAEAKQTDYENAVNNGSYIQEDSCIRLTTNLNLSAIRLVPTQAAYMGSGRMFAGVSSSSNVNITKTSAFTAQFVTKYIPSAFNTGSSNQIKETLTTNYSDTYLLDENGVGYTVKDLADGTVEVLNVVNSSNPNVKTYQVTKSGDAYKVSYLDENREVLTDDDGNNMTYSCKVKKQSSGFTLPKGTMITLLASLDEDNPTYWYYYCTKDTMEIKLEDFKKMNTSNVSSSQGNASVYDTIYTTSSSRVTENMIFVFDFEEVSDSDWNKVTALEGNLQLKHTYSSSVYDAVDIMDYVSTESKTSGGTTTISYNREMPRQTDTFKISSDSDGITRFGIENADQSSVYGQKDNMKFRLDITPDTNVTNTQYEEREYAVILKLKDKTSGEEIAFPEGTVFHYNGKRLAAGKDNKYVIVPVATVGSHEVEIESKLEGFDVNQYELMAALYSTSEDGYYNSIKIANNTGDQTSADFTIKADPVYAIKVTENSASSGDRKKNHFASTGESFKFKVTAQGGKADDAVSTGLYRYSNGKYKKVTLSTVLEDNAELKTGTESWNPKVQEGASKGTYRLEFVYHDKTEYWDFMVR